MDMVRLKAAARRKDSKAAALRSAGSVPCVLYGNDIENTMLQCGYRDLFRAYAAAGESTLVELELGGRKVPVLFHAIDLDPVSDAITHVDFYAVDMKKEIEARVPIHYTGESLAVKDLGGVLVHPYDHVTVKCLPSNLPHAIEVSLDMLAQFGDSLTVSNLRIPEGVLVLEAKDVVVTTVQQPREEEAPEEKPAEGVVPVEGAVAEGAAEEGEAAAKEGEEAEKKEKAEKASGRKKESS